MKLTIDGRIEDPDYEDVIRYSDWAERNTHKALRVCISDDNSFNTLASFYIMAGYDRCCGLREIGNLYVPSHLKLNLKEVHQKLLDFFSNSELFSNIGALHYTLVKNRDEKYQLRDSEVEFIKTWPNASHGKWWFNPNSGNMVQMWTLPVNQHRLHDVVVEDEGDCE